MIEDLFTRFPMPPGFAPRCLGRPPRPCAFGCTCHDPATPVCLCRRRRQRCSTCRQRRRRQLLHKTTVVPDTTGHECVTCRTCTNDNTRRELDGKVFCHACCLEERRRQYRVQRVVGADVDQEGRLWYTVLWETRQQEASNEPVDSSEELREDMAFCPRKLVEFWEQWYLENQGFPINPADLPSGDSEGIL